jgi:hypothetical protein
MQSSATQVAVEQESEDLYSTTPQVFVIAETALEQNFELQSSFLGLDEDGELPVPVASATQIFLKGETEEDHELSDDTQDQEDR